MKVIGKLLIPRILIIMFISVPSAASEPYVFKNFLPDATHQERLSSCQIPNDILETLSTEDLIETNFKYPFLINIYAYNSYEQGLSAVTDEFNGLRELFRRDDAASLLLERYISIDPSKIQYPRKEKLSRQELLEAIEPLDKIKFIEIILNHEVIFSRLMDSELKRLGQASINKINQFRSCPHEFVNQATMDTTTQLMVRYISLLKEKGNPIDAPLKIDIDKPATVDWLISIVRTYISHK